MFRLLRYEIAALLIVLASVGAMAQEGAQSVGQGGAAAESQNDSVKAVSSAYGRPQSVGLVLSGGGAKGIAHIGVIQALEDNDIPIDYITGTSMGSIVGGLYAAGYTPQEMMDLLLSKGFSYWSTGQIDPSLVYYLTTETPSPVMASFQITTKADSAFAARSAVPASLISPMPMSFAFMQLFSGYTAQCGGDFDRLFVPFRCVASDVAARHKVVFDHGNLGDAIRSSMSFPIVFQPTTVDSTLLYDGGIYDNFPVDVMKRDFAPDIMIGIDVSTEAIGPQTSLMDQLENLVIQNNDYYLDPADGIKIKIDLNEFGLLDFPAAKAIYQIGYDKTMEMIDSIKGRVTSRIPVEARELRRSVFKSQTPYVRFDSVEVRGGTPRQNDYIKYLFTGTRTDTFGIDRARSAFYRAISPGKLRQLTPQAVYNDSTGLFTLTLDASVKDNLSAGVGGYLTSSSTSYIYLTAGYSTLSFSSISANVGAWIGQSYLGAILSSRLYLRTGVPSALELQAVAFRRKYYDQDYLFFEDKAPSYILDHEYFGRLKWAWAVGSLCDMETGVGFGHLFDSFYQPDLSQGYLADKDHCRSNLGQVYVKFESNTLDNINFPTQGHYYKGMAMGVMGHFNQRVGDGQEHKARPRWVQFESVTRNYFSPSRHFSLGLESDVMISSRKLVGDYNAAIVAAPAFNPTPSSYNTFNPSLRANSFVALGLVPVYKFNSSLSARLGIHGFMPLRSIKQDADGMPVYSKHWFCKPELFGELDICYSLRIATVTAYCNYASGPSKYNVGLSFGIFLPAPRFLR